MCVCVCVQCACVGGGGGGGGVCVRTLTEQPMTSTEDSLLISTFTVILSFGEYAARSSLVARKIIGH